MNEEDSEQMGLYLESIGYQPVDSAERADVVLLNTCSVRAKPEEKVWSELGRLRELKRQRPDMIIGVCGCMAQVESEEITRRAPFVDLIVGTGNIASIPRLIRQIKAGAPVEPQARLRDLIPLTPVQRDTSAGRTAALTLEAPSARPHSPLTALTLPPRKGAIVSEVPERQTRRRPKLKAHVPIMYGCDKFCTFCIVPFTRGRERSRPTQEILAEIETLAQQGTREVTLLGQTVNSYGKNLPEGRVPFHILLERINQVRGLARIRFTSPYPRDFTDELIDAIGRLDKVCEHVHLPLQVADDDLLREMRRGYTVAQFRAIVEKLRARVPGIAITTDIMLGYPGETDAQFHNTLQFVEEIRFDSAFMFAYSPRPNTRAAQRTDQVPQSVKIERLNTLIALQNRITVEINQTQIGQIVEVLVEGPSQKDPSRLSGYTRTLKMVHFPAPATRSPESLIGRLVPVRLLEAHLTGFLGECADTL